MVEFLKWSLTKKLMIFHVQKSVDPRCGRLVAFESSDNNVIKPPTSGQRCALELGFTFDPNFQDGAHAEAETLLRSLENSKRQ